MHDTARQHGRLFFELYGCADFRTVVELGSQDVNGSLRDHCPAGIHYIGLDVMPAKGVDVVVMPGSPLPLAPETADAVLSSSVFEHDFCFWETFLELVRILRPGGLLYVNAPSNGGFHRHPVDCWRFYPDAGAAFVQWAARHGIGIELVESFIGRPQAEHWADFVAVFRKPGDGVLKRLGRIADHVPAINIATGGKSLGAPLEAEAESMPDMQIASGLRAELVANLANFAREKAAVADDLLAAEQRIGTISGYLTDMCDEAAATRRRLAATVARARGLEQRLAQVESQLAAIQASTSWRVTAGPRRLLQAIRGR